ncbi:MAG: NAD(P)/FAD-dependent oxidoreductase [Bacillota bacterium]
MSSKISVLIIGGGAAGLTAAIAACRAGAAVTILEKSQRVGRKILATGNGRCNLTNIDLDISHFHGSNPRFAHGALHRFDYDATLEFFHGLGILARVEDGRVYPLSNQASSVLDVLRYEIEMLGITTEVEATVKELSLTKGGFAAVTDDGRVFTAERVIVATGGMAAPAFGCTGDGYGFAGSFGHTVVQPHPALVQLHLDARFLRQIEGVRCEGRAAVVVDGTIVAEDEGELLFTSYGISGIPVLQISRAAAHCLQDGKEVMLHLDLLPQVGESELRLLLAERLRSQAHKGIAFNLVGMLNHKLAQVLVQEAGIPDIARPAGKITDVQREQLGSLLKDWRLRVTGTNPWSAAQTTAGGVDVSQVNPKTMESRLVPGLYFAGEVLDIDGDCGGYNLQWAWSSGYTAGDAAGQQRAQLVSTRSHQANSDRGQAGQPSPA